MKENKKFDVKLFIKENYKIMIPIALMLVLFVAFLVYYQVSVNNNYHVDTEEKVYQYFYDTKYEYTAIVSKNKKRVIVDYEPQDIKINIDSTPIYYQESSTVILPEDMSVIMPTLGCSEYLATGYSYITYENGIYNLTTNNYDNKLNHYFLYDGSDLYFFIESVTLEVNDKTITLTPFSYIVSKYHNYVSYYDKESDTYETIQTTEDVFVENEYYTINVSSDAIDYYGTDVLLTSAIENLNTIDKKD